MGLGRLPRSPFLNGARVGREALEKEVTFDSVGEVSALALSLCAVVVLASSLGCEEVAGSKLKSGIEAVLGEVRGEKRGEKIGSGEPGTIK